MIGYRRSSNKLIVSTSWLSMCYSSKSSAGTWLLHFNSSLAKLTIYYSMCWLRSEKMNWLLIRVALRGHRGETTHSLAISVNGGLFSDWDRQGRPRSPRLTETSKTVWKSQPQTWPSPSSASKAKWREAAASSSDDICQGRGPSSRDVWEFSSFFFPLLWLGEVP